MIKLKNFSLEWAQVFNLNHWEIKMKKAFLVMFLILSFSGNVFAELKIGFVKVDQILKDAPQAA